MTDEQHFTQDQRPDLLTSPRRKTLRKTARIVAVQQRFPFTVETDRGVMRGVSGDWLVTNHPMDDGASDLWTISDDRMQATYEEVAD